MTLCSALEKLKVDSTQMHNYDVATLATLTCLVTPTSKRMHSQQRADIYNSLI